MYACAIILDWCLFSRLATNANTVETIVHGSVGLLTARSGGHLVTLQCYVSPYDIFEEGTGSQLNLTDSNGKCIEDVAEEVVAFIHYEYILRMVIYTSQ